MTDQAEEHAARNPPRHPATATCDDTCPTWLHSRAVCCHFHVIPPNMVQRWKREADA